MFPSTGLFAHVSCPLLPRGVCERPHCFYKHAAAARREAAAWSRAPVTSAGVQDGLLDAAGATPMTVQAKGDSFLELERINKEIEAVRHEVEQERRRLSCYQTVQPNAANHSKCAPEGKPAGGVSSQTSCTHLSKTQTQERKYVVDNSKPRTDLEYDPLSNFSANLLCCNSKEAKARSQAAPAPASVPPTCVAPRCESPDPQDDDDCVLIIDVPLSPDKATDPHCQGDELFQESGDVKQSRPALPQTDASSSATSNLDDVDRDAESRRPSTFNDSSVSPAAEGNVIDLTGCLEALQSECDKIIALQSSDAVKGEQPEPTRLPELFDLQDFDLSDDRQEWRSSPGKRSPLHASQNSLCLEASASPQKQYNKPGQWQEKLSKDGVQDAEPGSGCGISQLQQPSSSSASTMLPLCTGSPSKSVGQTSVPEKEVICISSEEEEEEEEEEEACNHSDIELSDSDPMEECYRIFMEANDEGKADHAELSKEATAEVKPDVAQHAVAGKKRLAHGAVQTEPGAKRRPQPQVLVPFCEPTASGFSSQTSVAAKVQQAQRRGKMLNAAVRCGQAFGSSVIKKTPVTHSLSSALSPTQQTGPTHNAYSNYLPVGGTVVAMGNNLHLIVPEGAFPLSAPFSSCPVTSVLTPISHPATSTLTASQVYHHPDVAAGGRSRPAAPVLISALARKPVASVSAAPPAFPSPAPPANVQVAAKLTPVKRKLKQQQEPAKDKVPHDVRQRYVNMFTEEFFKTTPDVNEAFEKALAEEKTVYNRSMNKVKYQSVAVNALKRLRNQSASASQSKKEVNSQRLRGNVPLNPKNIGGKDDAALHECLKDYVLTEERLIENNYPIQHPEKPGFAVLFNSNKKVNTDPLMRICCRCGATYSVNQSGKPVRKEECTYHYGKGVTKRVPGGVETRYSCCEGVMGAPGCQVFQLHVHDFLSLDGFVSTPPRGSSDTSTPGVFSLNCEMCYAVSGLELSRVTVINSNLQVVYDTFVRPKSEVIDYNTRFSGISEADVKGIHTSITEVQETLLSFISADTILIGHSLERALCLLKLIHGMVVDTSVVFPHRLGPPNKLTLNKLTAEYLRRIIQDSVCGHDTAEDAAACMELMLWKVKEDGKLRK